jgi:hypothetical protein
LFSSIGWLVYIMVGQGQRRTCYAAPSDRLGDFQGFEGKNLPTMDAGKEQFQFAFLYC